ncbi:hypothetical protein QBC33DRAFT_562452 [Phialemonium atrogriseum]|uniref:Uncharacterized protein n=1 Tax=Phialemonium atrogriseum TaxID=1093897 RepID=A0AAJ0FE30_9PEZI|nr:uncharacterized protein QBC33DRAFT_562452 [Phialemonium atrogriseum]KAK1763872.1 hypothetical protein QBC33DRAFT_562452 [Phialemonium atrogriseum]
MVGWHAAGPTYIVPVESVCDNRSLSAYDFGLEAADRLFLTLPTRVDSHLSWDLLAVFTSQEPDRYAALSAAGFPVLDSEAAATRLLAEGKAGIEPVAYTAMTGLRFSDGTTADADAVVRCVHGVRRQGPLGGGGEGGAAGVNETGTGNGGGDPEASNDNLFGLRDSAARLDATWGVDSEGEIRGLWKGHLRLEN